MKDQIYALYRDIGESREYFYVGRTIDPKRRVQEHRRNAKNLKHTEDVYQYIRTLRPANTEIKSAGNGTHCGIELWDMEVMTDMENSRPEDFEDYFVVLLIRAGHKLQNMKRGDLHRIALELLAKKQGDFSTVDEFVEFRTRVEREQHEAFERSRKLRESVLAEEQGDPVMTEWIQGVSAAFRERNEVNVKRREAKEARARAKAIEKAEWLKSLRIGKSEN